MKNVHLQELVKKNRTKQERKYEWYVLWYDFSQLCNDDKLYNMLESVFLWLYARSKVSFVSS